MADKGIYDHFVMTKNISGPDLATLRDATDLSTVAWNVNLGNLTFGAVSVEAFDLVEDLRVFARRETTPELNRTAASDTVQRRERGRPMVEFSTQFFVNTETDHSADVVIKNPGGPRLLYVQRGNLSMAGLFQIFDLTDSDTDDAGDLFVTCMLKNFGRSYCNWS